MSVGLPIKQMMEQMSIRQAVESDEASVYDLILWGQNEVGFLGY